MKRFTLIVLAALLLSACAPSESQIATPVAATVAAIPTQTPYPTTTPWPTYTPDPTYTPWVITATSSPTPLASPTVTNTPEPTKDPLYSDKFAGIYLVGVDIAPGVWRSQGTGDDCYWVITTKTGDIIENHYGMSGGTMYVPETAFQVSMEAKCGTWVFLSQ